MKRHAIIIANAADDLNGVDADIENIAGFLMSLAGGAWFSNEITTFRNPRRHDLLAHLATVPDRNDFVMVFFTGHGGRHRDGTVLFLNEDGEFIHETSICGLGTRQLNLLDCCRSPVSDADLAGLLSESMGLGMESLGPELFDRLTARRVYSQRIMQALPQQTTLYACAETECSLDTRRGGLWLTALLEHAGHFEFTSPRFQTALSAQGAIASDVTRYSAQQNNKQHPDHVAARVREEQQLIISQNPYQQVHLYR